MPAQAKKVTPEAVVEHHILVWLRHNGVFAWKNVTGGFFDARLQRFRRQASPFAINGASDILGLLPTGRFLAIEVKSASGRLSDHQNAFLGQINANGGIAFVARSVEDVEKELRKHIILKNTS